MISKKDDSILLDSKIKANILIGLDNDHNIADIIST
jgi:hypothetical protein